MCCAHYLQRSASWSMLFAVCAAALFSSCSQSEPPPPSHNRHFITPDGHFVGHLKPELIDGPPVGVDGQPIVANDPVVWVVDNGAVSKPEYELDVNVFRLDFDEKKPITEDVMPFALMTETGRKIVVHRGPPPEGFSHPEINSGELCHGIHQCVNRECPRVQKIDNAALFPVPHGEESPKCPFCGGTEVEPYVMAQQRHMRDFVKRHPQ